MTKIKLIASDLDGTLLYNSGKTRHEMSDENYKKIKEWIDAGNIFCISTGRPARYLNVFKELYHLDVDYIGCNGAKVICENTILWDKTLSLNLLKKAYSALSPYKDEIDFSLDMDENLRIVLHLNGMINEVFSMSQFPHYTFEEYVTWDNPPLPNKVFLILKDKERQSYFINLLKETLQDEVMITSSGTRYIEFGCSGISKGDALKHLAEKYKLDVTEIAAIGDESNDVSMFETVEHSFSMAHARDEIKQKTKHTVSTVAECIEWCLKYNN